MRCRSNILFSLLLVIAVALWDFSVRRSVHAESVAPIKLITTEIVPRDSTFQRRLYDFTLKVISINLMAAIAKNCLAIRWKGAKIASFTHLKQSPTAIAWH